MIAGHFRFTSMAFRLILRGVKALPETVRNGNIILRQIWRDADYAVFQQVDCGFNFEAVRIRKGQGRETYPPSETWGVEGFTVNSRADALAKVEAMRQRETVADEAVIIS